MKSWLWRMENCKATGQHIMKTFVDGQDCVDERAGEWSVNRCLRLVEVERDD